MRNLLALLPFALVACSGEALLTGTVFSDEMGAGTGPGVAEATVTLTGAVDTTLTTASDGTFSVSVPFDSLVFVHTEAEGHTGLFQVEAIAGEDRDTTYGLNPHAAVDYIFGAVGLTRDADKGIVVVDFQTDSTAGGESADIDAPYEEVLQRDDLGQFVVGNEVPAGGNDTFITFVNVDAGSATVTPQAPAGQSCTMRRDLETWAVHANTVTTALVDCE